MQRRRSEARIDAPYRGAVSRRCRKGAVSRRRIEEVRMRAIVIRAPGGPEVLTLRDVPELAPPPSHVRVSVRYAGVNRADLMQRMGVYPAPPGVPHDIPGLEYAGVVDAIGEGVT